MEQDYTTVTDMSVLNKLAKIMWECPIATKQKKDPLGHTIQKKASYFRTEFTFELEPEEPECCGSTMDSDWNYCPYCGDDIEEQEKTIDIYGNSLKEAIEGLMEELSIDKAEAKQYGFTHRLQVRKDILEKLNLLNNKQN